MACNAENTWLAGPPSFSALSAVLVQRTLTYTVGQRIWREIENSKRIDGSSTEFDDCSLTIEDKKPRTSEECAQLDRRLQSQNEWIYAARFSVTIGRCWRPLTKSILSVNSSPGFPATNVCGFAHRDFRGHRDRGSHRG